MSNYTYQIDDELKVIEAPSGYKQMGMSRKVLAPSDALKGHAEAIKDFKDELEDLHEEFREETEGQEDEISTQIHHLEFFLKEKFKNHEWNHNQMFDRLRLSYISQLDGLKRELRQLRLRKIEKAFVFRKERMDTRKELSPFNRLFKVSSQYST
jgi:hypothetical protein